MSEVAMGSGPSNNTNAVWYKDPGIRKSVLLCCICLVAQMTAGYDEVTAGSFQSMAPWKKDMGYPDADRVGLISSMLYAGGVVGAIIGAPIADRIGRRGVMVTGACSCLIGSVLQTASVNVAMFILGRAFIGMGVTQTLIGGPSLVVELLHPRVRGTILAFYNVLWYVGSIIASWLTFGTGHLQNSWAWRISSLTQTCPSLFIICMIWLVPESPRWLLSKGRREEAHGILAKYHANGDYDDELVLLELQEIENSLEMEKAHDRQPWTVLIKTPGNRKRTLIVLGVAVFVSFSGQGIITYYFSPILNSIGVTSTNSQTGINGGMQVWNFLIAVLGACLVDKLGRRPLWIMSFAGMALAGIPLIITSAVYEKNGSLGAAYFSIVTLFLYNAAFNIGCNPLPYSYTAEILPFTIRAKGLGVFNIACWVFSIITTYCNPIALANIGWRYYCFYFGLCIIFTILVYLYFPETKGRTLEELNAFFDGEGSFPTIEGTGKDSDVEEEVEVIAEKA